MPEYTKRRYFELLLLQKNSKITDDEWSELLEYSSLTNNYLNWCFKEHYLTLLDNFMEEETIENETIKEKTIRKDHKLFTFCLNFCTAADLISDIVEKLEANLIILEPYQESISFSEKLEDLIEICFMYIDDLHLFENKSISELKLFQKEITDSIKTSYYDIKSALNK
jgi:hypothetical protein